MIVKVGLFALSLTSFLAFGDDVIHLWDQGGRTAVQVEGRNDDDWYVQRSQNLTAWSNIVEVGTLLSDRTNAPYKLFDPVGHVEFYRALRTKGLYDTNLMRTISLTFTNSAWRTALDGARSRGTNVPASLTMDNGASLSNVGARYKGNTSYTMGGAKKSINLSIDFTNSSARLMGYKTVNLNNAAADETIMREPLYFNLMRQYVPCPRGSVARLFINNEYWGVYCLIEQENSDLIKDWFPSTDGDRWRAPNISTDGGFGGSGSAFAFLGTNISSYTRNYELKSDNSTNAWQRLTNAIIILNRTPANELRDTVERVFAVDRWLWYLALENVLADDDSYWNKGADYGFYYEPESGRIHPVQHDGNEAFTVGDVSLSPLTGATGTNRPLLAKLLGIPELRQRYLAHIRTILAESFHPAVLTPAINHFHSLSVTAISNDTKKGFTMTSYTNDLVALRRWVTNRYTYLVNNADLRQVPPNILSVSEPQRPKPNEVPVITAQVQGVGTNGIDSVWLYWRDKTYDVFSRVQMLDDGAHADGAAEDGVFGGATTNYPAGHKIHYYVEARSSNSVKAASFAPRRAEEDPYDYRVGLASAPYTAVVINEVLAQNQTTLADPQGDFDDWIELRNLTSQPVDLSAHYLSDEPNNPRKWQFPAGTIIPADGYLLVWADEDGKDTPGLHASFRLSAAGESLFLTGTDATQNVVLDSVLFGPQDLDRSYFRSREDADQWLIGQPTPGSENP